VAEADDDVSSGAGSELTNVTIHHTLVASMDDQSAHFCIFQHLRKVVLQCIVLTALGMPAMAQSASFGAKVGLPVIDPFVLSSSLSSLNNYSFTTQRYTVGPTFELELPHKLSFQADALYKHLHYVSHPFGFNSFQAATTANSWEFPLVVKRYLLGEATRPYGNAGVSFRHVGGSTTFSNDVFRATQGPLELVHSWSTGFVAGGGVDVGYGSIHISPEIRYTRWATENLKASNGVLSSNLNGLDILISVTFHQ
jgi:opacity protein-like surface antigen